jgi:MAF protein
MVPSLWLASNSPRRRQLLGLTGWSFSVRPVDIDESPLPGEDPSVYVLRLAEAKARAACEGVPPGDIILASDTTVADGARILGKPVDADDARQMLRDLRGREHRVYTAVGAAGAQCGRLATDLCFTRVWMRSYSDAEIEDYIASGDPFDKAGGYAIQHPQFRPVERLEGCYACVMGLPVCHVVRLLASFGLPVPWNDVTAACPDYLGMDTPCPVHEQILRQGPGGIPERQSWKSE